MDVGCMTRRLGLKKAAKDICGMSEVSLRRSSTYCTGREMSCLTLKTDPVTAPSTDLIAAAQTKSLTRLRRPLYSAHSDGLEVQALSSRESLPGAARCRHTSSAQVHGRITRVADHRYS